MQCLIALMHINDSVKVFGTAKKNKRRGGRGGEGLRTAQLKGAESREGEEPPPKLQQPFAGPALFYIFS